MDMSDLIVEKCQELEEKNDFTILFAIESGSRLWGMSSFDSDYDVHLVFYYNVNRYLSLEKPPDTYYWMSGNRVIDLNGFDIYKYAKLLLKSNPNMIDWTMSPIIYYGSKERIPFMTDFAKKSFNPLSLYYYYYGIAESSRKLIEKRGKSSKKFLYVLRGLLNAKWIVDEGSLPPYDFEKVVSTLELDATIQKGIIHLLERKRNSSELGDIGAELKILYPFIEEQFALKEKNKEFLVSREPTKEQINQFDEEIRAIIHQ